MADPKPQPKKGGDPAAFVQEYGPIAERIGAEIGVDPRIILAQFGQETGWGKSIIPGTYNLGNIKDPSGKGQKAYDKVEKSNDAYLRFEDPEVFADYYADFIKRMYPKAVGAGSDVNKFTSGLNQGVRGSYATAEDYPLAIRSAYSTVLKVRPDGEQENPFDRVQPPSTEALESANQGGGDMPERSRSTEDAPYYGAAIGLGKGLLEKGTTVYRPESEKAILEAQKRLEIAQRNLSNPPATGFDKAALEAEYRAAQTNLTQIENELSQAQSRAAQTRIETKAPATGGGSGIPTDAQNQRVQLGTVDESGTTGRQRMGFNERTAAEAARREELARVQDELRRKGVLTDKNVLAQSPGMTTTKGGIQVPASAVYEDELLARQEAQRTAQQRASQGQDISRLTNEQKIRQKASEAARKKLEAAQEAERLAKLNAESGVRTAAENLEVKRAGAPNAGGLSNAQKAGKYFAKAPVLTNVAGGLGAGMSVDEAVKRYQAGDTSGMVLSVIEAALATASMAPPAGPVGLAAKGVGTVGGLAMIPVMIAHDYLRKRGAWAEPEKASQ